MATIAAAWSMGADNLSDSASAQFDRLLTLLAPRGVANVVKLDGLRSAFIARGMAYESGIDEQPYREAEVHILFDGELHKSCKRALICALQLPADCPTLALIATLWRRRGRQGLLDLQGHYVLALFDRTANSSLLQRDLLAGKPAFYCSESARSETGRGEALHRESGHLLLSGDALALQRSSGESMALNDAAVANLFCGQHSRDEQAIYRDIHCLQAGEQLLWENGLCSRLRQSWALEFAFTRSETWHQERLRAALETAIDDACGELCSEALAVSLSGGIDSNLVYALANQRARQLDQKPVDAISWSLESDPEANELAFARAHAHAWDADCWSFAGEPYATFAGMPRKAPNNNGLSSPFRELKTQVGELARERGVRRILNGNFGDLLFLSPHEFFSDTWANRQWQAASHALLARIKSDWRIWNDPALRRQIKRSLGLQIQGLSDAPELTELARAQRSAPFGALELTEQFHRFPSHRHALLTLNCSANAAFSSGAEEEFAEHIGVEQISPLRHRAVLAAMASMPIHLQVQSRVSKLCFRRLLPNQTPLAIRDRIKSSSLQGFFERALDGPAHARYERLLFDVSADWPRWMKHEQIERYFYAKARSDAQCAKIWLCASYELFREAIGIRPRP